MLKTPSEFKSANNLEFGSKLIALNGGGECACNTAGTAGPWTARGANLAKRSSVDANEKIPTELPLTLKTSPVEFTAMSRTSLW